MRRIVLRYADSGIAECRGRSEVIFWRLEKVLHHALRAQKGAPVVPKSHPVASGWPGGISYTIHHREDDSRVVLYRDMPNLRSQQRAPSDAPRCCNTMFRSSKGVSGAAECPETSV